MRIDDGPSGVATFEPDFNDGRVYLDVTMAQEGRVLNMVFGMAFFEDQAKPCQFVYRMIMSGEESPQAGRAAAQSR